ncbi:anaerobic ribonucleoside-triphosphate reductase [Patescibacteria group bacterium]
MQNTKTKRQKCEVFTRVVGYLRPVGQFNSGKRAEYEDRITFKCSNE